MAGNGCFAERLEKIGKYFLSLNDAEKNMTIMKIIQLSGPVQLQFLSNKLEMLVKRDFFKSLPPELSFHIIKWLDYGTLCCCCLVSREWNKVISSCNKAWMTACEELGVFQAKEEETELILNWKLKFITATQRFRKLRNTQTFGTRKLFGHTARVFALHYKDGLLASGSDDRTVRLWDMSSGHCKHVLSCHTCADLKFDRKKVLTASFDNTIGLWEWSSGDCLVKFQGHVGAVFCVDYNEELDLVVSGSSDCTVKLWQMSTGTCLATKLGHENWVTSVLLRHVDQDYQTKETGDHVVISMDKTCIKVWSASVSENFCIATLSCGGKSLGSFLPRLRCNGRDLVCSSDNGICIWNLATFQLTRLFIAFRNLWLVAHGEIFSMLLDVDHLYILNNATEQCIVKISLSRMRKSLRGSSFLAGEVAWLGDCSALFEDGVVFATSASDHSICVVEWNDNVSTKHS